MHLPILVSQEKWPEFEQAWKDRMASEDPIEDLLSAVQLAGDRKRIARCVPLAKEHAAMLEASDRVADAARLLGTTLIAGGNPPELTSDLLRCAEAAWSKEPWWGPYCELAGFQEGVPDLRNPWRTFSKACSFTTGRLVHHPGGWGTGEVLSVNAADMTIEVRFASGRKDDFPLSTAIDIFEPLNPQDLRSRHFRDPEGLRKQAKKDPLDIMTVIVSAYAGKATTAQIRIAMMGIGVEGSAWSAWWRKARKLAENSPEFEVSGSPQKSVVSMLLEKKDPSEALARQLERASGVAEVHAKLRELFVGAKEGDPLIPLAVDALDRMAQLETEPLNERLAAWLLLHEHRGEIPESMLETLQAVQEAPPPPDPSIPSALWALFQALGSLKDQERMAAFLPHFMGEDWLDQTYSNLQHAAPGMVRPLVDAFDKAGRKEDLRKTYSGLLARPLRAPGLMIALASANEKEDLGDEFPTPVQRAQALMSLAVHLFQTRRGHPYLTRVCARLTELLTGGKAPLLRRLLEGADTAGLRATAMLCNRGIDPEIDHLVTEICLEHDRQFFAHQVGFFWENDSIWTTKIGLERRSAELKELREVKIPENQDAIGRAASFGDLSENSEWEAAIEEQRTLTARAMEMEEELRRADLIENAAIPEDIVCPGTRVRYREAGAGSESWILILGPWDGDEYLGTQVVSYRAPLAGGLLGKSTGDKLEVQLPSGTIGIEVLEVEAVDLETERV